MAQVELRFFTEDLSNELKQRISGALSEIVFREHYPEQVAARSAEDTLHLQPGDITLIVPVLQTSLSRSNAQFEVEVTEGSSNWPDEPVELQTRAVRISGALAQLFPEISHNIFELNGRDTGWVQYAGRQAKSHE